MDKSSAQKPVRRIELKADRNQPSAVSSESGKSASNPQKKTGGNVKFSISQSERAPKENPQPAETPDLGAGKVRKSPLFEDRPATRIVQPGDESAANLMLSIEREARKAESEAELRFLMVNSTRKVVNYRQAFLLSKKGPKKYITEAISSLSAVDRTSNFVRWIEECVINSVTEQGEDKVALIKIDTEGSKENPDAKTYPFGNFVLIPMKMRDETVFAQLVLAREIPWQENDVTRASRLAETYAHAWEALTGPKVLSKRLRDKTLTAILTGVALAAAGFLPVPLTVLAPAEVTASNPIVVAAPLDGVLEKIEIEPNTMVKKGDLLFRFSDTELKNRVEVSGQKVQVAEARYLQAQRNSFSDPTSKRDLAIALTELKLKAAEYDYARDLLARTEVRAPQDGLIIFSDKETSDS